MDKALGQALFNSAHDRYHSTIRWTGFVVFILLIFHITTFHPYVNARQTLDAAATERNVLQALAPKLEALHKALNDLTRTSQARIDAVIEDLLTTKIQDFETLSRRVRILKGELPPEQPASIAIQMAPGAAGSPPSDLPPLDPELAEQVRQAPPDEIRHLLRDYIHTHIIERRFAEANRQLQQTVAPALMREIEVLQAQAAELITAKPQWQDRVQPLQAALAGTAEAAQALRLAPPANDEWWFSVAAKIQALDALGRELVQRLEAERLAGLGDNLQTALNQALAQQAGLVDALMQRIEALGEQFEALQQQVRTLGAPFQWLALDLELAAARFPLLLALALAGVSLSVSRRRQELALALQLLPETEQSLWHWYFQRTAGVPGHFPALASSPRALRVGLPELVVSLGWVALAVWQVAGWQGYGSGIGVLLLLGWAALLAAYAYRQSVFREAVRLSQGG